MIWGGAIDADPEAIPLNRTDAIAALGNNWGGKVKGVADAYCRIDANHDAVSEMSKLIKKLGWL